jgi:phage recombination protein Bet
MNNTAVTTAPATTGPSLVTKFAKRFDVDPGRLLATLKATCFQLRDKNAEVTNEQMMALLVVADQYGLNPFTKEIFAFEDKNKGVVPVVSVDGWSRMMNDHAMMDGIEFRFSDDLVTPTGGKSCPVWCEAVIYRKDRTRPTIVREFLDEVYVPPRGGYPGPWQSHTKRMLRHKAEIQCARIAFSFSGIYDEDEANRVIEGVATRVNATIVTDASKTGDLQARLEQRVVSQPIDGEIVTNNEDPNGADAAAPEDTNPNREE